RPVMTFTIHIGYTEGSLSRELPLPGGPEWVHRLPTRGKPARPGSLSTGPQRGPGQPERVSQGQPATPAVQQNIGQGRPRMTKLWHAFYSVTGCLLVLSLLCPMALAQQPQEARLAIDHAPFTTAQRRGAPLAIEARITSPAGIRKAEVFCRTLGGGD